MLVITRRIGESIHIGDDVVMTVTNIDMWRGSVSLGTQAPKEVPILREEVWLRGQHLKAEEAGKDKEPTR